MIYIIGKGVRMDRTYIIPFTGTVLISLFVGVILDHTLIPNENSSAQDIEIIYDTQREDGNEVK